MGVFLDLCHEIDIFNHDCEKENSFIEKVKLKIRLNKLNKTIEKLISLPNMNVETIYEFLITYEATYNIIKIENCNFTVTFSDILENYCFNKNNENYILECKMNAKYNNNVSVRFFDLNYSYSTEERNLLEMDFQDILAYQGSNEKTKKIIQIANDTLKEAIGKYLLCRLRG